MYLLRTETSSGQRKPISVAYREFDFGSANPHERQPHVSHAVDVQ
jgi:hypothetical protein